MSAHLAPQTFHDVIGLLDFEGKKNGESRERGMIVVGGK
jgi:hypothetical protein